VSSSARTSDPATWFWFAQIGMVGTSATGSYHLRVDISAFRILAAYIFGKNKGERRMQMTAPVTQTPEPRTIAMTAPVTQVATEAGYVIQFKMPAEFTLDTLPEPLDPQVRLKEVSIHSDPKGLGDGSGRSRMETDGRLRPRVVRIRCQPKVAVGAHQRREVTPA
jgi:hypothetical protein